MNLTKENKRAHFYLTVRILITRANDVVLGLSFFFYNVSNNYTALRWKSRFY